MDIDVTRIVGAVTRSVKTVQKDGQPAKEIVATRTYDTTPEDLWDALTNKERIPRWFLPITGELKLGGSYQFQGNAGGTITHCEPPTHLAVTWGMHGSVSWVDVHLSPAKTGTLLELRHVAHVPEELWAQFGPGAVGVGWDLALMGLGLHLETGKPNDAKEAEAWTVGPQGRVFVGLSSDDWARASIADGADPAQARKAAAGTTGFYTGTGPT